MNKKLLVVCLALSVVLGSMYLQANADEEIKVQGVIKEISMERQYLVVGDTKIIPQEGFLDTFYLDVGDAVEIIAEEAEDGTWYITDYTYIYDLDEDSTEY